MSVVPILIYLQYIHIYILLHHCTLRKLVVSSIFLQLKKLILNMVSIVAFQSPEAQLFFGIHNFPCRSSSCYSWHINLVNRVFLNRNPVMFALQRYKNIVLALPAKCNAIYLRGRLGATSIFDRCHKIPYAFITQKAIYILHNKYLIRPEGRKKKQQKKKIWNETLKRTTTKCVPRHHHLHNHMSKLCYLVEGSRCQRRSMKGGCVSSALISVPEKALRPVVLSFSLWSLPCIVGLRYCHKIRLFLFHDFKISQVQHVCLWHDA